MKLIGIILILLGLAITMVTGFNFTTQEKVVDIGNIEISKTNDHAVNWSPLAGIVLTVFGGMIYIIAKRKGIKS